MHERRDEILVHVQAIAIRTRYIVWREFSFTSPIASESSGIDDTTYRSHAIADVSARLSALPNDEVLKQISI